MVSIVVLCHNKADESRACLGSVLESRPADFELLAVDNGSTDDTPQALGQAARTAAARGIPFRALTPGRNLGCCAARNLAVAESRGDEILFLDNDTLAPDPAWVEKLRAVLHSEPRIGIVGPKLCYPDEPHNIQCAGVTIDPAGRIDFRGQGLPSDDPRFNRRQDVQALISACFLFPRSLFDEVGGLDESIHGVQYYEDLDFCYRARERGYRAVYTPDPVVYHRQGMTSHQATSDERRYFIIKHGLMFKQRWRHMFEKENGNFDPPCM